MIRLLGLLLFGIVATEAFAQVPYFQHYQPLKRNQVSTEVFFQDKSGYLWIGTDKGLFKYDGFSFEQFTVEDSLSDNHVTALAQDSLGSIWVGHANGMISIVSRSRVVPFAPDEGMPSVPISKLMFSKAGVLWFATLNDGLYYYRRNRLYRIDDAEGMPDLYVYDIAELPDGRIVAGTDGGIVICLPGDRPKLSVVDQQAGLPDNIVRKIRIDETGNAWLATEDVGLVMYNAESGKISHITPDWKYGTLYDLVLKDKKVWMATRLGGLVVVDTRTGSMRNNLTGYERGVEGLNTLLKDREGNIWIGTRSGLLRTHGDEMQFIEHFGGTADANILSVVIDSSGDLWFSNSEGLFRRTRDENGSEKYIKPLANTTYEKYRVISLYEDVNGSIWAGLYGEGVIRIQSGTGQITHLRKQLNNGNVLGIAGNEQDVWLATLGGASRIDLRTLSVRNYTQEDGLVSDFIYQVFIDRQGRVWFGTDGKGVVMMDEKGFHHFEQVRGSNVAFGFAEDTNGHIWANIQGDALYRYDGERFSAMDSLAIRSEHVYGFTSDKVGNLVMFHEQGIDIYDVVNNRMRYFGEEVGVKEKVPNLNSLDKDAEHNIYVATNDGIVVYASAQLGGDAKPKPLIEGVYIGNDFVATPKNLILKHNRNYLRIVYKGLLYQNPEAVTYAYQLENYDMEWISSQNAMVTYSNLPPGLYVFNLKATTTGSFDGNELASFTVLIKPPFTQTSAFYFLCGASLLLVFFALVKYREKSLIREKEVLELRVAERTEEIHKQSEELRAKSHEIQSQADQILAMNQNLEALVSERTKQLELKNRALEEYAFLNAHQLRAPLASILGLVNLLKKADLNDHDKETLQRLHESAERLETIIREITITIQKGEGKHW